MHTCVLIHGLNLYANAWESIVWGNPQNGVYGRIARGFVEALRRDATTISFATGDAEKDGLKSGEYSFRLARERIATQPEFSSWGEEKARACCV
jgi:hypothetical protein